VGAVSAVFTDRRGGGSGPPYDEANLATHVGDRSAAVAANRERLLAGLGVPSAAWMNQVHGVDVVVVAEPAVEPPTCDALVTSTPGLALAVLVADCVPVLISDAAAGLVAAVHAGRRGAAGGIVLRTLGVLRELGARAPRAVLGPAICGRCYEVPEDMRADVEARLPGSAALTSRGTPGLDLRAGLARQLNAAGVPVETSPACTAEDPALFSHRRDGVTGRQAGLVVIR
jgi:YfiH family protein